MAYCSMGEEQAGRRASTAVARLPWLTVNPDDYLGLGGAAPTRGKSLALAAARQLGMTKTPRAAVDSVATGRAWRYQIYHIPAGSGFLTPKTMKAKATAGRERLRREAAVLMGEGMPWATMNPRGYLGLGDPRLPWATLSPQAAAYGYLGDEYVGMGLNLGKIAGGIVKAATGVDVGGGSSPSKDPERFSRNSSWLSLAIGGDKTALDALKYMSGRFGATTLPQPYGKVGGWGTQPARDDAYAKYLQAQTTLGQTGRATGTAVATVDTRPKSSGLVNALSKLLGQQVASNATSGSMIAAGAGSQVMPGVATGEATTAPAGGMPGWVLPVGIGVVALLLLSKKK